MRISHIAKGNGTIRKYERIKLAAKVKGTCAAGMFTAGAIFASNQSGIGAVLCGLNSCMYIKDLEKYLNFMLFLKPEVVAIIQRAKNNF